MFAAWDLIQPNRTVVYCRGLRIRDVKASTLYRIAAVLLALFAIGHTIGFRQDNPEWGASAVISSMKATHFDAQGFTRTYWDFFSAFGFFDSVFLVFAAVVAWQLGGVSPVSFDPFMRRTSWALSSCFVVLTALTWKYAFTTPLVFSSVITFVLITATWLSAKPT